MNIIHLNHQDFIGDSNEVIIRDYRLTHILKILKPTIGQSLHVGILGGQCGNGIVVSMHPEAVVLRVSLTEPSPPRHTFDIILALPRPKMLRRIFRTVAEYGVNNLHLINSARVEKSYWQSPLLKPDKIHNALLAGMERSKDTIITNVHLHKRFRPFIEDQLSSVCGSRNCWITDINAKEAAFALSSKPAVVMIGPEGGFVPFEIELAVSQTAQPIHLGTRTLSVDTALTTVLAQSLPCTTSTNT